MQGTKTQLNISRKHISTLNTSGGHSASPQQQAAAAEAEHVGQIHDSDGGFMGQDHSLQLAFCLMVLNQSSLRTQCTSGSQATSQSPACSYMVAKMAASGKLSPWQLSLQEPMAQPQSTKPTAASSQAHPCLQAPTAPAQQHQAVCQGQHQTACVGWSQLSLASKAGWFGNSRNWLLCGNGPVLSVM
jgi:hypothetical protein